MLCLALMLIQGCATDLGPPLEARWYYEIPRLPPKTTSKSPPAHARPQIEVLLLNRTSHEIAISEVFLNAYGSERDRDDAKTWVLIGEIFLPPGGYRILSTNAFAGGAHPDPKLSGKPFSARCLLPVSLAVKLSGDRAPLWLQYAYGRYIDDDNGRVRVEMLARLPSSIQDAWRDCTAGEAHGIGAAIPFKPDMGTSDSGIREGY